MDTHRASPAPLQPIPASAAADATAVAPPQLLAVRARATRLLAERYAANAMSLTQLDATLNRLYAAAGEAEVDAIVQKLLGASQVQAPVERRILVFMGEARRIGRWAVPRLLRVRAFMGEVKIDLRDVSIPEGFVLDVRVRAARVTLIVPPGVSVGFDVFAMMGNAINQADELSPDGAPPRVRVTGGVLMGEMRVLVREPRV